MERMETVGQRPPEQIIENDLKHLDYFDYLDYFGAYYHEGGVERACRCKQARGYGFCREDRGSYPECGMSCHIDDNAECDDAKTDSEGKRISCKACKRVRLYKGGRVSPNSRSGLIYWNENQFIW